MIKDVQSLQKFVEDVIEDSLDCIVNLNNAQVAVGTTFSNCLLRVLRKGTSRNIRIDFLPSSLNLVTSSNSTYALNATTGSDGWLSTITINSFNLPFFFEGNDVLDPITVYYR